MLLYAVVMTALVPVAVPLSVGIDIVVAVEVLLSRRSLLLVAVVFERELVQGHDPIDSFDESDDDTRYG
jgi:hypothetical protein